MPGAYSHLTMVVEAASRNELSAIPGFPNDATIACTRWRKFCELGAVSPDYPYLHLVNEMISGSSKRWADHMHNVTTDGVIKFCIEQLRGMENPARDKCLAWLLGYTSHVVTDVTIHPVINKKVGPYEQNKREHRVCEMNQDVWIFPRLNLGSVKLAEFLDQGIGTCEKAKVDLIMTSVSCG